MKTRGRLAKHSTFIHRSRLQDPGSSRRHQPPAQAQNRRRAWSHNSSPRSRKSGPGAPTGQTAHGQLRTCFVPALYPESPYLGTASTPQGGARLSVWLPNLRSTRVPSLLPPRRGPGSSETQHLEGFGFPSRGQGMRRREHASPPSQNPESGEQFPEAARRLSLGDKNRVGKGSHRDLQGVNYSLKTELSRHRQSGCWFTSSYSPSR